MTLTNPQRGRRLCPKALVLSMTLLVAGCAAHREPPVWGGEQRRAWSLRAAHAPEAGGAWEAGGASWGGTPAEPGGWREEASRRARAVEEARVREWVRAAQREGKGPEAEEEAREAEVERALAYGVGLASGVKEVGAEVVLTFWVEDRALTLVGYRQEGGGGRVGRSVEPEALRRVLRLVFSEYVGRHTGMVALRLRREEAGWEVDYSANHHAPRPPEARTLPVRAGGAAAETFLALHEAGSEWLRAVRVSPGGAVRVEMVVHLEDGRLAGWELRTLQRTREGRGGSPRPLSAEVSAAVTRVLLPFSEGLGRRTVAVVLWAEHRLGEEEARGRVESAQVERAPYAPEQGWYRAMHEATLLRWREGVVEGSAWLSQRGVEEAALWFAGGVFAHGAGFFASQGLKLVPRALGRSPEAAAGWLRTTLIRLPGKERRSFEQLWRKVQLEGERALSRSERDSLRGLMQGMETIVTRPLDDQQKKLLRSAARKRYKRLRPEVEAPMDDYPDLYPVHHRRPLEHAQLFPDEDINGAENLILVRGYVHDCINFLWTKFRKARPKPTAQEVERMARLIDEHFESWYHRVDLPDEMPVAVKEAEQAAWGEFQRLFSGLK
jgi:hypothetical protein